MGNYQPNRENLLMDPKTNMSEKMKQERINAILMLHSSISENFSYIGQFELYEDYSKESLVILTKKELLI